MTTSAGLVLVWIRLEISIVDRVSVRDEVAAVASRDLRLVVLEIKKNSPE